MTYDEEVSIQGNTCSLGMLALENAADCRNWKKASYLFDCGASERNDVVVNKVASWLLSKVHENAHHTCDGTVAGLFQR